MKNLKLTIPLKAISYNKVHRNGKRPNQRFLTKEALEFKRIFSAFLNLKYSKEIKSFEFKPRSQAIEVHYIWGVPSSKLFTKSGALSIMGMDVDNGIKYTKDCLFNCLQLNDKYVYKTSATKVPSSKGYYIDIVLIVREFKDIY